MAEQRVSCGRDFFCVPDLAAALKNATNGGYRGLSLLSTLLKCQGKHYLDTNSSFLARDTWFKDRSPRSLSINAYLRSFSDVFYVDTILWWFCNGYWLNYRIHGHSFPDQLCKPSTSSRVCLTVSNSPNLSHVYIKLCKHGKHFLLLKYSRCGTNQL